MIQLTITTTIQITIGLDSEVWIWQADREANMGAIWSVILVQVGTCAAVFWDLVHHVSSKQRCLLQWCNILLHINNADITSCYWTKICAVPHRWQHVQSSGSRAHCSCVQSRGDASFQRLFPSQEVLEAATAHTAFDSSWVDVIFRRSYGEDNQCRRACAQNVHYRCVFLGWRHNKDTFLCLVALSTVL